MSTITVSAGWLDKEKVPLPTVKQDIYVYDEDNIIDDDVEAKLNTLLVNVEKQTSAEIAVITVADLMGMEIEDYSYELANTLGIGKAEEDNGVLLLISKTDEKVRLEIGAGLEGCLPDSRCGRILDEFFVPYRENGEYSEGTYKTVEAVVSFVAKEYQVSIDDVDNQIATQIEQDEEEDLKKTITILVIILIVVVVGLVLDRIFLDGIIFEILIDVLASGGGSGSSGGGFGGGGFRGGGATR